MYIKEKKLEDIVEQIKSHVGQNPALISVAEHAEIDVDLLVQCLNEKGVEFIGGVFPKIIHQTQVYDQGLVVNTLQNTEKLGLIKNISQKDFDIPSFEFNHEKQYTFITYVDGLTSNISNYLNSIYNIYGMQTHYFGGGAGSLSLEQKPCVFNKEGVYQDAAVYAMVSMNCSIGVNHGWEKIEGPFIVTSAEGNIIKELNWQNPFEVYKDVVEEHSNQKFSEDNFFDIAKGYPFGIVKDNSKSIVVRDPLMVNDQNELVCVGELENNMLVNILNGDNQSLIHAAKLACEESASHIKKPHKAIVINCISRVLFLEDEFGKELNIIHKTLQENHPNISVCGALTLGEISSSGQGFLEFYNKTVVVGLFE